MSLDFSLEKEITEVRDVFSRNITHNLGRMAREAGVYEALWRPGEHGYGHARDVVAVLERGLADLLARPDYFTQFNSPNGWGLYEHFVPFVESVLQACREYPDAEIRVSR